MSAEDRQQLQQNTARLLEGHQAPSHVLLGIDVSGRGLPAPLVQVRILPSMVVLRIDDELNPEAWVEVIISEELFQRIADEQYAASVASGGEQPSG